MAHQSYIVYGSGMGAAFVPFTVPTVSLYNRMSYYGTKPASYSAVDAMYLYYVKGIHEQGAKPIDFKASDKDNKAIWSWMGKKYDAKTIQNFFRALHDIPEGWWRLGKNSIGEVLLAAPVDAAKKVVGTAKSAVKATAGTAGDLVGAAGSAFFGKFSKTTLIIAGGITLVLVGGGVYIAVKAVKP